MQYTRLGGSGLQVSCICLGMMSYGSPQWRSWVLDGDAARPFVQRAAEAGITFYDTADVYSDGVSEEVTGRLLREVFDDRERYVLATKCFMPVGERHPNGMGLSAKHVHAACDASLRRLGVEYIDLYQIHRFDPRTPVEETMGALHRLVEAGKVRYLGASSMWAWQFATMQHTAERNGWTPFVAMQNHYNLLYREEEREMLPLCRDTGVGVIPWSPLARGLLAGTRGSGDERRTERARTDDNADRWYANVDFDIVKRTQEVAEQRGVAPAQVALAWLLAQPAITAPIIGATKLEHLEQAVDAVDVVLSEDERAYLEQLYRPQPVAGHG